MPSMMSVCHDRAYAGCPCREYLPPLAWRSYNSTQNAKCSLGLLSLAATVTGHLILLLILCHVEKVVHIGEPTSSKGRSSMTFLRARSLMILSSKSHMRPS